MNGSYSCPCSTTLNGQRKAAQKLGCMRPNSSQDTGASWSPRQKVRGGTEIPTSLKDNVILPHCRWVTYSSVTLLTRHFPTEPFIACTVEERRNKLPNTTLASNSLCIYHRICQWYETDHQVLTPSTAEDKEQMITQKR